jgi:hypothetical protein
MMPKEKIMTEPTVVINVRGVPRDAWRAVRAEAARVGKNTGEMLGEIIRKALKLERKGE